MWWVTGRFSIDDQSNSNQRWIKCDAQICVGSSAHTRFAYHTHFCKLPSNRYLGKLPWGLTRYSYWIRHLNISQNSSAARGVFGIIRSLWNLTGVSSVKFQSNTIIWIHHGDVIMSAMASQIPSITIVCSNFYSGADQRKHQSSASLAFVRGIHRWPMNSPHKGSVTRKMFPFDDVIMYQSCGFDADWDLTIRRLIWY